MKSIKKVDEVFENLPESLDAILTESHITEDEDLLPEFCHYKDEGCALAKSCLNCPFPHCIHDKPRGKFNLARKLRDKKIIQVRRKEKLTIKELALRFNVSEHTAARVVAGIGKRMPPQQRR